jgi:hypothetical protein
MAAKRKKDFVTGFAIFLFFSIVIFEVVTVVWLPIHLRSEKLWIKQTAYIEIVDMEDGLRGKFSSLSRRFKDRKGGEIMLVRICLDEIARYLRVNGSNMNMNQIAELKTLLVGFEDIFNRMKVYGKFYTREEKVDADPFIRQLAEKCGIEIPIPKKEAEKETEDKDGKSKTE